MATDEFVPGNLVLVDFPGSGNWPCQVSRIISKNWRQVEYFGGGEEIGDAHVQVIRDYDEATKDDLEEFIPQKKMDKDPVLRKAVKQINQKLAGKNTRISGEGITTRSESKKMSYKKETGGKHKSQNTSEKKEMSAAIKETRKTRQKKEFSGNKNDVKKTLGKGELKKMKIAEKKAFIGARNKTETIPGINRIIRTTKGNDKKKENPRNLRAGVSDGLINADNPECQQSRPNNEGPLANTNIGISQEINSHLLLRSGSTSLSTRCGNLENSSSGAIISTSVNNHGVADDVDIIIKCEIDEDSNNNSDTVGTEDLNPPSTPEDTVLPIISATSENGGTFPAEDISARGSSDSSENGGTFPAEHISDSSENGGTFPAEHISASEAATAGSLATKEISGPNTIEDISAQEATAPRSSASSDTGNSSASSSVGIMANNQGDSGHTEDTVKLNISMEMTPNTFSQISPALLAFVSQPNVTVHINVPQ